MANENETVEQVCEEIRNDWACLYYSEGTRRKNGERSDVPVIETEKLAERILAAHKREIAAKDAEIAKRNTLIGQLAYILKITSKKYFECEERMCAFCGKKCGRNEANRLINEARNMC